MLGRLFRSAGGAKAPPARTLSHLGDLQPGDVVALGPTAPAELAGATLTAGSVTAFTYDQPIGKRSVITFNYDRYQVRAWRGEDGRAALARELLLPDARATCKMRDLDALFRSKASETVAVRIRKKTPATIAPWVAADAYRRESMHKAIQHAGADPVPFDFYRLVASARTHALEFEVHAGGRTRAWAILYPTSTMIEGLWARGTRNGGRP